VRKLETAIFFWLKKLGFLIARDTKAGAPSRVVMDFQGDDVFNQEDVDGIVKNSITSVLTDAM